MSRHHLARGDDYNSQLALPAIVPAPTMAALTPSSGLVGQSITITATNFGATKGTSTLKFFNNITATPTAWANTTITTPVPTGATTGSVSVRWAVRRAMR